jgi:hypothetical protein
MENVMPGIPVSFTISDNAVLTGSAVGCTSLHTPDAASDTAKNAPER